MALYSYNRFTEKPKNLQTFCSHIRNVLQSYCITAKPGYVRGNWAQEAIAFEQVVKLYNSDQNDPELIIQLRDKTREFANSLKSTYHWATSTFIGSWAADLISAPAGGGGSTLKQSLEDVLNEFEDLFRRAEEAIEQAKQLEAAKQKAVDAQRAAQTALEAYHQQRASQSYRY
ncbi:MAG: hypothetical protein U1E78_06670 [Gammaproteobacteria bacterium]